MSRDLLTRGIVVGHRVLAASLVDTVETITGAREGLVAVSNEGCTPEELQRRIEEVAGGGPVVLFVDLASGSCALAARRVAAGREDAPVVTGVNLPILLDFVFHRELAPATLAGRLVGKGREAVRAFPPPDTEPSDADPADQD